MALKQPSSAGKNAELSEDIRHIETIRKGIGDALELGVEANQGWLVSMVDRVPPWDLVRAKSFAAACHINDIKWLEEPLDSRDYDGNAALKEASQVKISGAELNYGWDETKIMFEKDCFDIYQPDATFHSFINPYFRTSVAASVLKPLFLKRGCFIHTALFI